MPDKTLTTKRKIKLPAFYLHHWKDGKPASCFTDGNAPPKYIATDWFVSFHPEREVEVDEFNIAKPEHSNGVVMGKQIDLSKFIPMGQKLSFRQRLRGIA